MARLTDQDREAILTDWKLGDTQNHLAKKYNCSPATVNKLCKGVIQDSREIVNTQMAVNRALEGKSEYEVNKIADKVNTKLRHEELINGNAMLLAGKLKTMAEQIDTPNDLKTLAEANDKLAITLKVADRHAPKIDITQQQQVGLAIQRKVIVNPSSEKDKIGG